MCFSRRCCVRIQLNGEWKDFDGGITVAGLLSQLGFEPRRVAVECNKKLVPRTIHDQTPLSENDCLEIVTLVGGG